MKPLKSMTHEELQKWFAVQLELEALLGYEEGVLERDERYAVIAVARIPRTVTENGSQTFAGFEHLNKVWIGDGLQKIGSHAFASCGCLREVRIPESVTEIGDHAFSDCRRIAEIVVPDDVESIGEHAFEGVSRIIYDGPVDSADNWGAGEWLKKQNKTAYSAVFKAVPPTGNALQKISFP